MEVVDEGKAECNLVTDGFTGNAKAIEGTIKLILRLLKDSLLNNGFIPKLAPCWLNQD